MNLKQAKQKIQRFKETFAEQYGEGHYLFACHAAFPIGFTPDMLYQIWANFREYPVGGNTEARAEIDLIAISDLMLSPLCSKTGRNLYEMDVKIRAVLLDELRTERFAALNRMEELAYFIFQYLDSIVAQYEYESFRETLYWNTLVTIAPQQAFYEVTQKLGQYITENNEGEIMRMRNLLESFAYQDQGIEQMGNSNFGKLLSYTKALKASILDYPAEVINQQIRESGAIAFTSDPSVAQGSIEIPLLEDMMEKVDPTSANLGEFETPPEPTKEVFALTVGIDEYLYPSLRLNGCINDVNLINTYLKETIQEDHDYTLELTSFTNEKATAENVRNTLAQFREEAGPEDIVFFYFAGHSVKDQMGLDYTSLILHDTRIEWGKENNVTKVEEFQLESLVAEGWACDVVLVIDTHYAAAVLQQQYNHVIYLAACGADQEAFEHRIGNRTNGLFTFNLVKALRDHEGNLTYQQLFQEVSLQMKDSGFDQTSVLTASKQQSYKYFLGEYTPQSEELFNRIEAARTAESPELDLSNLNISFIPPEVFELDFLISLNLSNNQIDGCPTKLNSLRKLQRLDLRNNQITRINLDVLAKRSLDEIYLSGNPIADIPPEMLDGSTKRLLQYLEDRKKDARNLFALFIAIDEYPRFKDAEKVQLRAAVSDAQAIRQALKKRFQTSPEFNLQHYDLYNEEVNKGYIFKTISEITSRAQENDVFLLYFAGHDSTTPSGEAVWALTNSNGTFDGQEEISAGELERFIQPLLERHVNTILLNPPRWTGSLHESLVVVEPGIFNNEGPMPDGSYHSLFVYELLQRFDVKGKTVSYQDLQTMGQKTPAFHQSRTASKNLPVVKTPKLNHSKVFIYSELGYGQQFRQRLQEARSTNALDLSGMNLDHIPPAVFNLNNLVALNLAGNEIDFLPERITALKALERLELEGNPILNLSAGLLVEGSVSDIQSYFSSLEKSETSLPVIISLFYDMEDILEQVPGEIEKVLTPYVEQELLVSEALINPTSNEVYRLFRYYEDSEIALLNISANTGKKEIQILDPRKEKLGITADSFRKLLGENLSIKMVLMDGSDSAALAEKILEWGVVAAVGVEGNSTTDIALNFWKTFYQELGQGGSLREAFREVESIYKDTSHKSKKQ